MKAVSFLKCLHICYTVLLVLLLDTTILKFNRQIQGAKEKYRGVFEIQRSGDKTSSGEIGLDIRTHASPKVGQDQVSGGVSVLCWHAAPVAYVLWKLGKESNSVIRSRSVMVKNWCNVLSMDRIISYACQIAANKLYE